ncbi:Rpn family recombination-promoting nuclease/putative transposase [Romboutsia lituseburensis]|uniref:PD-(D/E)XK nuclease family transposase n=1 Tax=Romboutsia lituseburensis DSM 797 TaxID=1121325 RepID=A0A1G9PKI9_9FIRM|nr:Rpn family recombination-promoting nuclease/putative transposase [Romboutsia lituseburensis]CEH33427.1 T_den_put_tspse: conserved hypothetical protein [Romboutsia lituseburensis]SDL99239.1 conserved hypothetical protein (putative transposase or invertase) [Romboutsia lituseburensis DSM 797]
MRGLLDPKMDFVFKNIFGNEKNPKILISFLNATLKPQYLIHFIEIPKLEEGSDEKDMLVNWVEFLRDPESERVRSLEMNIEEIRQAKDELIKMSNDDTQRQIYEMRAKTLKDKVSALNEAERKGIEKGIEKGEKNKAIEIAKSLLDVLDLETIALKTGLSEDEITNLK